MMKKYQFCNIILVSLAINVK